MPFLAPIIGAALPGIIGGVAGAANPRPPSLSPVQSQSLNQLLPQLMQQIQGPVRIDPVQQALLYNQNAQNLTGANNQVTNALVSRGLGHSGLLGAGLIQNANASQANQNQINLGLQNQAIQQRQANIQDILGLLNVNNTPGQSGFGSFMSGMAGPLSYSIQNMMNNNANNSWLNSGPYGMTGNGQLPINTANPGPSLNPLPQPPLQ